MSPELKARFDLNSQIASANRASFDSSAVVAISLVGPAGSGKTCLIESLVSKLNPAIRTAAIIGDLVADRQFERISRHGCHAVTIASASLDANNVRQATEQLDLLELDLVLIESEGKTEGAVQFDMGHHLRACAFSTAGGDDKATEYPYLIAGSDVVLLTKIDLLPLVKFDLKVFEQDVARIKPRVPIIQMSVQSNQGIAMWVKWIESHVSPKARRRMAEHSVNQSW